MKLPIVGTEGYEITNDGIVISYKHNKLGKIISPYIDKDGYVCFHIRIGGKSKGLKVHREVAKAFIPNPNNLKQVNHINGIKSDNSVHNLEWCDNLHNQQHAWITGLKIIKLTVDDVIKIKELLKQNNTNKDIANTFNVDPSTISNIKRGITWIHVVPQSNVLVST